MQIIVEAKTREGYNVTFSWDADDASPHEAIDEAAEFSNALKQAGYKTRYTPRQGGGSRRSNMYPAFWVEDVKYARIRLFWPRYTDDKKSLFSDLGKMAYQLTRKYSGVAEYHQFRYDTDSGSQQYYVFDKGEQNDRDNPLPSDIPPYTHLAISSQYYADIAAEFPLIRETWTGSPDEYRGEGKYPVPDELGWEQPDMVEGEEDRFQAIVDYAIEHMEGALASAQFSEEEINDLHDDIRLKAVDYAARICSLFDGKTDFTDSQKEASKNMLKRTAEEFTKKASGDDRRL